VCLLPEHSLSVVVLSNAFPTGVPDALCEIYFDLVFKGRVTDDWIAKWNAAYASMFAPAVEAAKKAYGARPSPTSPALADEAYEGSYANDYLGKAEIVSENGGHVLKLRPDCVRSFPLKHFDRDLFLIFAEPEQPDLSSAVTFTIGPDGRASQVTIEAFDDDGQGALTRTE
jgi:hypothetical protein